MKPATKGDKARAALDALVILMSTAKDIDATIKLAMEAGRWGAISRYSGYLSTKQIDEELELMLSQDLGADVALQYQACLEIR